LLREHKIHTAEELRELIDGKTSLDDKVSYTILRDGDLPLDGESRWYEDEFEFRRTIFDCEKIWLRNSSQIDLRDCIFLGSPFISQGDDSTATKVYMDSCIVQQTLQVRVGENKGSSIGLTDVFSEKLRVVQSHASEVDILRGAFGETELERLEAPQLTVMDSSLGQLRFSDCHFERVVFPPGQVNVRRLPGKHLLERIFARRPKFDAFDAQMKSTNSDAYWAQRSKEERTRQMIETYDFFLDKTEIRHSKRDTSHIKYLRAMAESHSCASRFFVFSTGAFLKPSRMLLLSVAMLCAFAAIYALPRWRFAIAGTSSNVVSTLNLPDAMYFSCVTFTTLGYGDIVPVGGVRAMAMIEAFSES
jgi:Ion channel